MLTIVLLVLLIITVGTSFAIINRISENNLQLNLKLLRANMKLDTCYDILFDMNAKHQMPTADIEALVDRITGEHNPVIKQTLIDKLIALSK